MFGVKVEMREPPKRLFFLGGEEMQGGLNR